MFYRIIVLKAGQERILNGSRIVTAWKVSKYGVISGPYFSVFGAEITPYLNTFHALIGTCLGDSLRSDWFIQQRKKQWFR